MNLYMDDAPAPDPQDIGAVVRWFMAENELGARELAILANVSSTSVYRVLNEPLCHLRPETAQMIADAMYMDRDEVFLSGHLASTGRYPGDDAHVGGRRSRGDQSRAAHRKSVIRVVQVDKSICLNCHLSTSASGACGC